MTDQDYQHHRAALLTQVRNRAKMVVRGNELLDKPGTDTKAMLVALSKVTGEFERQVANYLKLVQLRERATYTSNMGSKSPLKEG